MTRRRIALLAAIALTGASASLFVLHNPQPSKAAREAQRVPDFALLDHTGRFHALYRYAGARAVVLYSYGLECSAAREGVAPLQRVRNQFKAQNVAFLMIDANPRDDRAALQQEASQAGIDIPILQDDSQLVIESLQITHTAEAILLDPKTWQVLYRGPIEDLRASTSPPSKTGRNYLVEALNVFLGGRQVALPVPVGGGCAIETLGGATREASYAADIVPILRAKCIQCHRRGGIGSWAMDSYQQIKTWSPRMREVILTRRMPPWHADPAIGTFSPDRSLSVEARRTLVHWIDTGAPRGASADPLVESPAAPVEDWALGRPDLVVELPVQEIPATGTVEYRYIWMPVPLTRDTWIRAVDLRPSNRAVMHHALVFVHYPPWLSAKEPRWDQGAHSFFAGYAPGFEIRPFPKDSGEFLPFGSTLEFQLHYMTVGSQTTDRPKLALYLLKKPPALEYKVESAANHDLHIPPYAADYEVGATYVFQRSATLHGLAPHMHFRGSRMRYEARYPDGTAEVLLSVPKYDFNWQTLYQLQVPKPIPAGTQITVRGAFDNSERNPANPDPSREVRWGGQSTDEMFIGYLMYTEPVERK